jgi:hypothetical protein
MKEFLNNTRQMLETVATKVQKAINPPLSDDASPLDIQQAILEELEMRSQPIGGGRRVLPDRYVKVRIVAKDPAAERALLAGLSGLTEKAVARLRELQCEIPAGFRIDVGYVRKRSASWPDERPIAVDYEADPPVAREAHPQAPPARAAQPQLVLTVVRGRATADTYALRQPTINVGRSAMPVDNRGHARNNDVIFSDEEDPHSRTVGRGHCQIRYDSAAGEYRVFDERSANGTRIMRRGHVIQVPAADPFGVAIKPGDELEFGTAAVRVDIVQ